MLKKTSSDGIGWRPLLKPPRSVSF